MIHRLLSGEQPDFLYSVPFALHNQLNSRLAFSVYIG